MTNFFFYWYMFFVVIYNLNIKNDKGVVGMYQIYNASENELHFNVHYLDETVPPLETFEGNWLDLRAIEVKVIRANGEVETHKSSEFETVNYEKDDVLFVNFGFAMDMTDLETGEKYVANIFPRSSLFKNFNLFLTNHVGCIDHSYKGNDDMWKGMFLAMGSGELHKGDRLAQFEVKKTQPKLVLHPVDDLGNKSRGGYGHSGRN